MDRLSKGKGKEEGDKKRDQKKPSKQKQAREKTSEGKCPRCHGSFHAKRLCPPRESKYIKCSKVSHWAKACRSHSDKMVGEVNFSGTQYDEEFFLGEVTKLL